METALSSDLPPLLAGYRPLDGVPDEMLDSTGAIRPLWQDFALALGGMTEDQLAQHVLRADQYLNDSGVFFRQYGAGASTERPWPIAHLPVLLDHAEWFGIAAALAQRGDLLEALMADFYGPNRMVAEGKLPAALVAGNPAFVRPMVGIRPRSGHFLHFLAFELGRGPDGRWWVLSDRAQAPSGAGYALENRVATTRAFADLLAQDRIHRLAGFFRDFRAALLAQTGGQDSRVGILTPGPMNETYFEHAYMARYLGFSLLQGDDLTVTSGRVMLRTVDGTQPVDVLWRRLDDGWLDPLELDPASALGTPGLMGALRAGGVHMVNAPGSGMIETRALMAFLPQMAHDLLGERLAIPNIATWWCGDAAARDAVRARETEMVLARGISTALPFDPSSAGIPVASLTQSALDMRLRSEGPALVAQEAVSLSTTPALIDGKLVARPMMLRLFMARTQNGWRVMPGGFARIGGSDDPAAIAMQRGGRAADVWVLDSAPVQAETLIAAQTGPSPRPRPGALPARVADNLFWLGRYVERTEAMLRLLRGWHMRLAEGARSDHPLLAHVLPLMASYGLETTQPVPDGLRNALRAAMASAGQVRDRFSPDAWQALRDIDTTMDRFASRVQPGADAARAYSVLLRKLAGLTGLIHENMYRVLGWRFLSIGRHLERALAMAQVLNNLTAPDAPAGALDMAIEYGDSVLTHRRRFTLTTSVENVLDLLVLDPMNPRALRHQLDAMRDQVAALPGAQTGGRLSPLARAVFRLDADMVAIGPNELDPDRLADLVTRLLDLSDLLTAEYLQ